MDIDLFKLAEAANKRYKGNERIIEFFLQQDGFLRISKGNTVYFADHKKLMDVLEKNNADYRDQEMAYDILAKHISNQHNAAHGKKIHPEIVTCKGDLIQ